MSSEEPYTELKPHWLDSLSGWTEIQKNSKYGKGSPTAHRVRHRELYKKEGVDPRLVPPPTPGKVYDASDAAPPRTARTPRTPRARGCAPPPFAPGARARRS